MSAVAPSSYDDGAIDRQSTTDVARLCCHYFCYSYCLDVRWVDAIQPHRSYRTARCHRLRDAWSLRFQAGKATNWQADFEAARQKRSPDYCLLAARDAAGMLMSSGNGDGRTQWPHRHRR